MLIEVAKNGRLGYMYSDDDVSVYGGKEALLSMVFAPVDGDDITAILDAPDNVASDWMYDFGSQTFIEPAPIPSVVTDQEKISAILTSLQILDSKGERSTQAIVSGTATDEDKEILAGIIDAKEKLRAELADLQAKIAAGENDGASG